MTRQWQLRPVRDDLVTWYLDQGWWDGDTLGTTVAAGLGRLATVTFAVHSKVRPWRGTFAEIDRAARTFAGTLRRLGIGPGDVVAFQLPNWAEAAITFWGAAYAGATVLPIVHFYGAKEVGYILRTVRPDLLVTAGRFGYSDYLETYSGLLDPDARRRWLVVGDTTPAALPAGAVPFGSALDGDPLPAPLPADPESPAVIGFTSGTTRDPKGVIHSHRTILCETRQLCQLSPPTDFPSLIGTPVGHFMGMVAALLVPLLRDRPVHMVDAWNPCDVLRIMREDELGVAGAAPYFLTSLLDHPDCTSERIARIPFTGLGGSTVPVAVADRATRLGIKVYRSYGSTEHPSITASFLDEPEVKRLTTDGHPLPGVEIRLDEDGQILSRGPDRFLGYTDPDLTARAIDSGGWYHTGDVGVLDDDGYLTITDRISDIIIRGGENISPQEIEELLLGMDPVAEVSVVAAPDERMGEHAAAVVRVRQGESLPTLGQVREHLRRAGTARQKWPESIYEIADFPRTPSGKVQKFKLRAMLHDGQLRVGTS